MLKESDTMLFPYSTKGILPISNAMSLLFIHPSSAIQCCLPFHLRLRINYTYIPQLYPYSILLIVHAVSLYRSVTIHVTDSYAMPMLFMYSSAVIMV